MVLHRIAVASVVLGLVACGGSKPPPLSADDADGGAPADPAAAGGDPAASSGGTDSTAGGAAADAPPGPVACQMSPSVCSETTLGGKEATDAKDKCKAASGEPKDGECGHDDAIATCGVEAKKLTYYYYKAADAKGALKTAKDACKTAGGTFTPKAGGGGGGGGGKKKPGGGGGGKKK